jgi:hypothetical protein
MTRSEVLKQLAEQQAAGVFYAGERVNPLAEKYYRRHEKRIRKLLTRQCRAMSDLQRNRFSQIG